MPAFGQVFLKVDSAPRFDHHTAQPKVFSALESYQAARSEAGVPSVVWVNTNSWRTNVHHEQLLRVATQRPHFLPGLLSRVRSQKPTLTEALAEAVPLDMSALPLDPRLVAMARALTEARHPFVLAGNLDEDTLRRLAERLGASTTVISVPGAGDRAGPEVVEALERACPDGYTLLDPTVQAPDVTEDFWWGRTVRPVLKVMRLHQWSKNLLVFVPAILSGSIFDPTVVLHLTVLFVAMGLVASSTYVVNDLCDVDADRAHWSKCERPIANGTLPIARAAFTAAIAMALGLGLAALVGWSALAGVVLYVAMTLAYSAGLKRVVMFDALTLAMLFTARLGIGTVAAGADPSAWLFVFSMFFFFSLALAKRHTEMAKAIALGRSGLTKRGYRSEDLPLVLATGIASGIASGVVIVLYIVEDAYQRSFIGSTGWLWAFPPLVQLLIIRVWLTCQRGELHDDPVFFILKDRLSLLVAACLSVSFLFAWGGPGF